MKKIFEKESEEREYLTWVNSNRSWFVVNQRKSGKDHLMMHRASCDHISNPSRVRGPILKDFRKVCVDERNEAEDWMKVNISIMHEIRRCSYCSP